MCGRFTELGWPVGLLRRGVTDEQIHSEWEELMENMEAFT